MNTMKIGKSAMVAMAAGALVMMLGGCPQKEGPGEKAGKAVDSAVDKAGEKIEKAGKAVDSAVDKAGQKIEKAGEAVQDAAKGDKK